MNNTPRVCIWVIALVLVLTGQVWAQSISLVAIGSTWKYLDDGTDQGTAWRGLAFNDSIWPAGPAQLGFGDGDEATVVSRTSPSGVTNLTYYFRHAFSVGAPLAATNLLVRLRRDDGAIVYLNDTEIFRSNLPPGPVTATTLALTATADDGANYFANSAAPSLLRAGPNVLAVEVHQSAASSSDVSFDLELIANVEFQRPSVAITSPTNGASLGSMNLTVNATAADVDGTIAMVEFLNGDTVIGADVQAPFSLVWSNIAVGTYTMRAVAIDSTGLNATSAPVEITMHPRLVAVGSEWRYLDTGEDPGPLWTSPAFADDAWLVGLAQLGFGDGDEATVLSRTNSVGATNITYHFRQTFDVATLPAISNLVIRIVRDDGCIAYLNGVEVFRDNLPPGPVTPTTLAVDAIDDLRFRAAHINPGLLLPGRNLLAVEVHQAALTSSDVSFDLELRPNVPPAPPSIAISAPTNGSRYLEPANVTVNTTTADYDDRILSVGFLVNGTLLSTDATEPYSLVMTSLTAGDYTVAAVATDEQGHTTTSSPVTFAVVKPAVVASLIATGSVWRYFDVGTDLRTGWREPSFDDSAWKSGPGKLGSNDNPVTTFDIGPATNRYLTTYFRHRFEATGARTVTNLGFRVLRDDGCVVYLNGFELFRMNMAPGSMTYTNRALTAIGGTNENYYFPYSMGPPAGVLIDGENVLAVELHQNDPSSTDAGFDLGLVTVTPPDAVALSISMVNATLVINWPGASHVLQAAPAVEGPYTDVTPTVSIAPYVTPLPAVDRYFRLRRTP